MPSTASNLRALVTLSLALMVCTCLSEKTPGEADPRKPADFSNGGSSSAGAAVGGSGGNSASGGVTSEGARLPVSSLVFSRRVPRGRFWTNHLYVVDLETKNERLLSNLDDDGATTNTIVGGQPSISPDRAWVAFGAIRFRQTPEEKLHHHAAVWSLSADGKMFRRLSPPPPPEDQMLRCAYLDSNGSPTPPSGTSCPFGMTCTMAGVCIYANLDIETNSPTWSNDAATIYFQHTLSYNCIQGTFDICVGTAIGAVTDGKLALTGSDCKSNSGVAVLPNSTRLLVARSGCDRGGDGLQEWAPSPLGVARTAVASTAQARVQTERAAWLPDGSGALFVMQTRSTERLRTSLARWTASDGQVTTVYGPQKEVDVDVDAVTVSPNGTIVIDGATGTDYATKKHDLFTVDAATGSLTALTHSGDATDPSF